MPNSPIVTRSSAPVQTTVGSEIVLMTLGSGECIGLGETGSEVWRQIEHPISVDDLVSNLKHTYQAPDGVIEQDVHELLQRFSELKLVELDAPALP